MYIMYVHSHTNITQLLRQTSVGILLIILVNRCCVEMGDVHICKTQQMAAQDEHIASLLPTQHCASMVLAVAWCLSVTSRYCINGRMDHGGFWHGASSNLFNIKHYVTSTVATLGISDQKQISGNFLC